MHLRLIMEMVERLRRDPALRQQVALDPDTALAGTSFTHDERLALAALSRQPDAAAARSHRAW
jgi:hypothetical protein